MAKEMLINVSEGEECRIALLEDGRLEELYMERASSTTHVGNIYKGRVTNVEASIQAAFVDFGLGRNGFLHISDLMPSYFGRRGDEVTEKVGRKVSRRDRPPIQRCLRRGDEIIVQVLKEGIGTKGPTLTSYLSIAGRMLVMMPGLDGMGVSRKIEDDAERRRLRQILDSLQPSREMSFIIRTAGVGKTKADIQRDFTYLTRLWEQIEKLRDSGPCPMQLYAEGDLVTRTVRDVFTSDVDRLIVDNADVARRVEDVIRLSSPRTKYKVELYEDAVPIFHKYGIEKEIELMHSRHVPLPSGGSLVIDSTEAVVAIDVNSGKSREHNDAETTAFKTDMEAADEITRQLRLRDLGGVIICDFIDLRYERHRNELEDRLNENFKKDKAKFKVLPMSQFGIIEITRSRRGPSLKRSIYYDCPHCKGHGLVKTPESMSLDVMRRLAIATHDARVMRVELTVCEEVGFYLQNKKRMQLATLELENKKQIVVKTEPNLGLDETKLELFDARESRVYLADLGMTPEQMGVGQQRQHGQQNRGPQQNQRRGQQQNRPGLPPARGGRPHQEEESDEREDRYDLDRAEDQVEDREGQGDGEEEDSSRSVLGPPSAAATTPLANTLARINADKAARAAREAEAAAARSTGVGADDEDDEADEDGDAREAQGQDRDEDDRHDESDSEPESDDDLVPQAAGDRDEDEDDDERERDEDDAGTEAQPEEEDEDSFSGNSVEGSYSGQRPPRDNRGQHRRDGQRGGGFNRGGGRPGNQGGGGPQHAQRQVGQRQDGRGDPRGNGRNDSRAAQQPSGPRDNRGDRGSRPDPRVAARGGDPRQDGRRDSRNNPRPEGRDDRGPRPDSRDNRDNRGQQRSDSRGDQREDRGQRPAGRNDGPRHEARRDEARRDEARRDDARNEGPRHEPRRDDGPRDDRGQRTDSRGDARHNLPRPDARPDPRLPRQPQPQDDRGDNRSAGAGTGDANRGPVVGREGETGELTDDGQRRRRRRRRGGRRGRNREGFEGNEQSANAPAGPGGESSDEFRSDGEGEDQREGRSRDADGDANAEELRQNQDAADLRSDFEPAYEPARDRRDDANAGSDANANANANADAEELRGEASLFEDRREDRDADRSRDSRPAGAAASPAEAPAAEVEAADEKPQRPTRRRRAPAKRSGASGEGDPSPAAETAEESPAPAAKGRTPRGKGRSRKAATAGTESAEPTPTPDAATADAAPAGAGVTDAEATEATAGRRGRPRKAVARPRRKAPAPAGDDATTEGESTPPADAPPARPPRPVSTDSHQLAADEPVAPEPLPRPRTYRDLDAIPDDFD